jgi:DnaJ-class molecular chaperone
MNLTPEEILNLPENYNLSDIKHSFYALSRQYHPDSSNCTFLSPEDKKNIFIVLETAYKELLDKHQFIEIDAPMYSNVEYSDDVYIEKDNNLDSVEKFNKQFEQVHSEENKDNPWSIHYEKNKVDKHYNLDILRPDEYRRKYYYEFGIDYCDDFTQPGKFTDISHLSDDLSNVNLESTDLDTLLKSRETIEYSEEINLQEIQKQQVMSQLQHDRHQVQLERDLKILKLDTC